MTPRRRLFELQQHVLALHEKNYIHRDIKPENFMMGVGPNKSCLHIIDYGLAKRYRKTCGQHIAEEQFRPAIGTKRYLSKNVLSGVTPSRRDDLISVIYILIYFRSGNLPWVGLDDKNPDKSSKQINELAIQKRNQPGTVV